MPALIPVWRWLGQNVPSKYHQVQSYLTRKVPRSKFQGSEMWPRNRHISNEDRMTLLPNNAQNASRGVNLNAATATGKFGLPKITIDGSNGIDLHEWTG